MRALWLAFFLLACWFSSGRAEAQMHEREVRRYYYQTLRKSELKALALDAALPGVGSAYVGVYANAIVTAAVSVAGAALWTAGAVRDDRVLWWTGAGLFIGGRTYGLVSAPLSATLLNRALSRQLNLEAAPKPGLLY